MYLEYISNTAMFGIACVMFLCGGYQKIRIPCYMRFISLVLGFIAFSFLFSDDQLNYTLKGAIYRVVAFLWSIGMIYFVSVFYRKRFRL